MKAPLPALLFRAPLCSAILLAGCVSVGEYGQVKEQLALEQGKAFDREKHARELEVLAENLRRRLELAEVERNEARERLRAASRALALKPPDPASRRPPTPAARPAPSEGSLVSTISFDAGSAGISDQARNEIARIARMLGGKDRFEVLVCGHSDPTPIERSQAKFLSNMHLSAMRALAVYHELVARPGIDAARVCVTAWGPHKPPDRGTRDLRRVEIRVRRVQSSRARPRPSGEAASSRKPEVQPAARPSPTRVTRPARSVPTTVPPTVRKRPTEPKPASRPVPKPPGGHVLPRGNGGAGTAPAKPAPVPPRPPAGKPKVPAPAAGPEKEPAPPVDEPEPWR